MADGASGLGLAHTHACTHTHKHRKRRGEGILPHIVKTSIAYCSAAVFPHFRNKSSHAVVSFGFWIFLC